MISEKIAVLIPALNPNHKLVDVVKELNQTGLVNVVVIDDGSENASQAIFDQVRAYGAQVYQHKKNRGKGAALRTGIEYIRQSQPRIAGVVTADADGQHAPHDILKVGEEMATHDEIVLGTRDFGHADVPWANKMANLFSAVYYRLKTGRVLNDTQTGLRGIPARHFDFALGVEGDRYDYEMRFLEEMNEKKIAYRTVDIETIYEEDRVSHFRAVTDSYVIYKPFIRNIASSLLSAIVDIISFMLLAHVGSSIFSATAIARAISGVFNFSLNKIWVFEKKESHNTRNESLKYLALFVVQMISSGLLTEALSAALNFNGGLLLSKVLVDCGLFVTNFFVQRFWIFPSNRRTVHSKRNSKHAFAILYTVMLVAVTAWSLLDTFVIADKVAAVDETLANTSIYVDLEDEYSSSSSNSDLVELSSGSTLDSDVDEDSSGSTSDSDVVEDANSSDSDSASGGDSTGSSEAAIITDSSYQDSNIQITIEVIREYDTDIYIADVVVSDIAYLKTALAENTYGRNIKETTSDMAEEHDAILAINGDYYGFRNAGFVIRNGVLYQTTARSGSSEALVINADGSFEIVEESSSEAQALYDEGALQVFAFGPGLIEDGEISVTSSSEVSQSKSSNPRTAIGMIDELHYIFVVSDGRTSQSEGLSLLELATVMQEYGCTEAYNLDGGGSSTMVFNGEVINNPTSGRSSGERKVSDIIYIGAYL